MKLEELELISYGKNKFIKSKWEEIKNKGWNKPNGGLWSSPENSKYGWKEFVKDELYKPIEYIRSYLKFRLRSDSKVYIISSQLDLINIPFKTKRSQHMSYQFIDFEKMKSEGYDAIWLTLEGERNTRYGGMDFGFALDNYEMNLYGWDVETVLILNPECIVFPTVKIVIDRGKYGRNYSTTNKKFNSLRSLIRYYRKFRYTVGHEGLYEPIICNKRKIGYVSIKYKNPKENNYMKVLDAEFSNYIDENFWDLV